MSIDQFSEEHPWEFMMTLMEFEGGLIATRATLDFLLMLMIKGII